MLKPLLALFCIGIGCTAEAQSFTCPIGRRAACLEYGDTVCSTLGRCVDSNAVCFSQFECNYEGFTCRSNLTDCSDEYEALRRRFNTLVDEHNTLVDEHNQLAAEHTALIDEAAQQASAIVVMASVIECVRVAEDAEDVSFCLMQQ